MMYFYRLSRWLFLAHIPVLPKLIKILIRILFSCVLPPSAKVGRNVVFGYQGLGIVVHRNAVIGNNVVIGPNVTIGGRSGFQQVPVIEDNVLIGAGARVLGPVTIGKNAKIGANAVVLTDVPANAVAVGIPAKVIRLGDSQ